MLILNWDVSPLISSKYLQINYHLKYFTSFKVSAFTIGLIGNMQINYHL